MIGFRKDAGSPARREEAGSINDAPDGGEPGEGGPRQRKLRSYALLHASLLIYSLSVVCSKMASQHDFGSIGFFAWYGAVLVLLAVYAFVWQQVLKRLPLVTSYANKAVTIVWGVLWGALLFQEAIGPGILIGGALVIAGVVMVALDG